MTVGRVRRAGVRRPLARRRGAGGRRGARRRPDHGCPAPPAGLELPEAPSYVVFLVDGLGARAARARTPTRRRTSPRCWTGTHAGTAGVPSTTATSLTSLGTGLPPGAHGAGRVHQPGARAPTGCSTRCSGTRTWTRSSGSRTRPRSPGCARPGVAGHRGQQARVPRQRADRRGAARRGVRRRRPGRASGSPPRSRPPPTGPSLTYLYDGDLDWTGHRYGVASPQWLPAARDRSTPRPSSCARRCPRRPGCSWSPTTAWSTRPPTHRIDVDDAPRAARRARAVRRGGAVPAPLLPRRRGRRRAGRPGASSSATGPWC